MSSISEKSVEMVKVKIASEERSVEDVNPSWINQQIDRRRKDGPVCVRVTIHDDGINMVLSSGDCPRSAGGGRPPRHQERAIFDLWDKHRLNEPNFPSGHLVAFIKQLPRLL